MDCKSVYMRCDCHAETLEFCRFEHCNNEASYELNVVDSYCGYDLMGIKNRFKRAWKAFFEQPVCYTGVYTDDPLKMKKFLEDCIQLMENQKANEN